MNFLNVDIPVKNVPELDKGFVPLGLFFKNYQKGAAKPLCIAPVCWRNWSVSCCSRTARMKFC